jgi:hypothetical protein
MTHAMPQNTNQIKSRCKRNVKPRTPHPNSFTFSHACLLKRDLSDSEEDPSILLIAVSGHLGYFRTTDPAYDCESSGVDHDDETKYAECHIADFAEGGAGYAFVVEHWLYAVSYKSPRRREELTG